MFRVENTYFDVIRLNMEFHVLDKEISRVDKKWTDKQST